jgi:hypothetical protein
MGSNNTLFRIQIEKKIVEELLIHIGFLGLHDKKMFTKFNIPKDKFEEIVIQIEPYYIPCKAKRFLYDLNEGKQITILRHLLRAIGYDLLVQEKVLHNLKTTTYQIYQKFLSHDLSGTYLMEFI